MKLTRLFEQEKSVEVYSDGGHSTVLRILPFRSLNRRICGTLTLIQICSAYTPQTSHITRTLSEMPAVALMEDDKDVEFG